MKIGQLYYESNPTPEEQDYSNNIIAGLAITSLNIYACPGSRFKINEISDIIINGTGSFSLNCNDFPITSIKMHKNNLVNNIPTIIDYVSLEV